MKKSTIVCMLVSVLMLGACGNTTSKKNDTSSNAAESSSEEQDLTKDVVAKMDSLISSLQQLGFMPHLQAITDGKLVLTGKEKRVKPTSLMPLSKANDLVTLGQKNRALAVYVIEKKVAELYGLPTEEYDQVIGKLAVETDNQAILDGAKINIEINSYDLNTWILTMGKEQLEKEQVNMFFEWFAAAMVENLYFASLDIPRYIVYFNDETASDVSYRFLLTVDAIESLLPYYPELEIIKGIIEPLKVINAISVKQLEKQLNTLTDDIAAAREKLLE